MSYTPEQAPKAGEFTPDKDRSRVVLFAVATIKQAGEKGRFVPKLAETVLSIASPESALKAPAATDNLSEIRRIVGEEAA